MAARRLPLSSAGVTEDELQDKAKIDEDHFLEITDEEGADESDAHVAEPGPKRRIYKLVPRRSLFA